MAKKRRKPKMEFRYYQMPAGTTILDLLGQKSVQNYENDVDYLHFHNYLEIGFCYEGDGFMAFGEAEMRFSGRKISLPYCMEARKDYDGVKLYLLNKEERRKRKTEEWELIVPGKAICPLGTFSAEIFLYEGQKIEEKKYTKWLDYDKIKKNPCIRTRRTGDYMIINAQGNTKKLNRCMIDAKIPADQREKIPLVVCENEVLWMVGSRMNERYKINPQTRKVLVLNYQGGYQNE